MEWERGVWWLTGSRWARKFAVVTVALAAVWLTQYGPLIEWRQERILERMQPFLDQMTSPPGAGATPSSPAVP